jgi:hypothetical protein
VPWQRPLRKRFVPKWHRLYLTFGCLPPNGCVLFTHDQGDDLSFFIVLQTAPRFDEFTIEAASSAEKAFPWKLLAEPSVGTGWIQERGAGRYFFRLAL